MMVWFNSGITIFDSSTVVRAMFMSPESVSGPAVFMTNFTVISGGLHV
jgi:hypothetical protein